MEQRDFDYNSILIFVPHPDDGEFGVGGSMAKWAAEGREVVLCVVTNGACGSNDPNFKRNDLIKAREQEQRAAARVTGIKDVIFLGHEDGHLEDSHELRRDIIREIRRYKPEVVVGVDPTSYYFEQRYVNHPDHRRLGEAFLAAVNPGATTVPLYREELYDQGFLPHQVKACLLFMTSKPDYFVDISEYLDVKTESIMAHTSQTPEFRNDILPLLKDMARRSSEAAGNPEGYAEGFKSFFFDHRDPSNTGSPGE